MRFEDVEGKLRVQMGEFANGCISCFLWVSGVLANRIALILFVGSRQVP